MVPLRSAQGLTFGCVPHVDDENTRVLLGDLCRTLSEHVNATVAPHRASSPASLASAVGTGRVDVAWVSPVLFLTAPELRDAVPLVSTVREGGSVYHAVVFTDAESAIRSPSDLVGARLAWVGKSSASGYLVPRLTLAARGIRPGEHFVDERFLDSHGAVAKAVQSGEADAGGTYAVFEGADPTKKLLRSGFGDTCPGWSARVLLSAGPIPADLVVVRRGVSARTRASLITAFESLGGSSDSAVLIARIFNAEGFRCYEPGVFNELLSDVETGRELGLFDDE